MKEKSRFFLAVLLILAGLLCGVMGLRAWFQEKNAGSDYDRIRDAAFHVRNEAQSSGWGLTTKVYAASEEEKPEIPVDFEALQKDYPDIYAWIQIPDTKVDYPIVQHENDNSYYLNHTVEGKEKPEGAIFTEDYNEKDFKDPNTIIYGHNMKNGSMFRGLHDYQDRKFFKEHQDLVIYLPEQILHYKIFAAYIYDDRHLMKSFDFEDEKVYASYLQSIFTHNQMGDVIDNTAEVTKEDRIITLSTCNGNSSQRYLVQAVLVSEEPETEQENGD